MALKLVSSTDLTRAQIESLFGRADEIANGALPNLDQTGVGLALFNIAFPLPINAQEILRDAGAQITPIESADKINAASAQVILFSSPQTDIARQLSGNVSASFLNAGDGMHENPVRALMDAYAIRTLKGELGQQLIAILGNLKFSAEAHSLARVLGMFGGRISFVSPAALSMPYDLTDEVRLTAYEVEETNDLATTLRKTDTLYLSNIDSSRVEKKIYDKQKDFYKLTPDIFREAKEGLAILGEWDGAEEILATTRPQVERAGRAMLLALVESAR
ncbi:MAG: hypothetical protein EYC68_00565 [Chloroflexota bacterium]|nr:MAG: hypothetical protein EYC68_00565 [Chloroflexota bacterium]